MYHRFRLSTHRKNEFRKRRAGNQKCVVITETLWVEQASHEDNLIQQLPERHPTETTLVVTIPRSVISVLRLSVDIEHYLRTPIESLVQLKSKLSRISILPQGWIDMTGHTNSSTITISRVEGGGEHKQVCISCSLAVSSNLTWHVVVKEKVFSSNVEHFSALPQTILFVRDVLTVLECVESLTLCVGIRDEISLQCEGQDIEWSHLRCLYKRNRTVTETPSLAMLHKLKYEHVNLTSFSKMRVDLAAQVLSSSVANALRVTLKDRATATATFCDMFDRFFDCLNVTNFDTGKRSRNPFKSPYRSAKDFRLKWLKDEFLTYLDCWEKSVHDREGFSSAEKKMMLLSQETRNGLRITVKSFVELSQYLFTLPDVSVFLSNRLCQDPLEKFFGQQRQRGRANENPNAVEFFRNTQALRVINTTCANIRGNCRGSNRKAVDINGLENVPIPKRKRTSHSTEH